MDRMPFDLRNLLRSRSRPLAVLVLLIALAATLWTWRQSHADMVREAQHHFEQRVAEVMRAIEQRMDAYEQVLRGVAAFMHANGSVDRAQWSSYVGNLALSSNYPGIQGIGFAAYRGPEQLPELERQVRAEGFSDFRVWPPGERETYTPIVYLEPFNWRNRRAFGYDMFSETNRRAAMSRARDEGAAIASAKVQLVQETDEDVQAGFLMYLPVYRGAAVPASVVQRRERIVGFVYSPFRMHDLMHGILGPAAPELAIRIYDGRTPTGDDLMYAAGEGFAEAAFDTTRTLEINGRTWVVEFASLPVLEAAVLHRDRPLLVLVVGSSLSLLLFALVWTVGRTEARAWSLARTMSQAFRRSEAKFASLVQAAQDAIVIADANGRIAAWNRGATEMFGYHEQDVLGRPWIMVLPERIRDDYERARRELLAGADRNLNRPLLLRAVRRNGEEFPAEVSLARWGAEGDTFISAIIRDITERQQVERALRLSETRFRTIFESAAIGIVLTDVDGRILEANLTFHGMLGYDAAELRAQPYHELVHPDDRLETRRLVAEVAASGRTFAKRKERYLRKDGSVMWGSLTTSLIRNDNDGAPRLLVRMIEDVTELRAAEEKLNRAYRELEDRVEARTRELREQTEELARSNAELEQFAYVASHDLQEPLRSVSGFAQLLERRYRDRLGDEGLTFVRFIVTGTDRMRALITDLLAYSRAGAREKPLAPVEMEAVLAAVLAGLDARIGERGAQILHDPLPVVWGDAADLEQLLQNLIANAIKFNESSPPRVELRVADDGSHWRFAVRDNGIGIEPSFFPRIFTIFQRGHRQEQYAGTGVGLAICKKVVDRHHGRIWMESVPDEGTTFFFTLPKPPA